MKIFFLVAIIMALFALADASASAGGSSGVPRPRLIRYGGRYYIKYPYKCLRYRYRSGRIVLKCYYRYKRYYRSPTRTQSRYQPRPTTQQPTTSYPSKPSAPAPSGGSGGLVDSAARAATNMYRSTQGKRAMGYDPKSDKMCRNRAGYMRQAGNMDHNVVRSFSSECSQYGGGACAENIAAGSFNPQSVCKAWWESPGHKANMLKDLDAVVTCQDSKYWSQNFNNH